jgi:serine/threonine-protein kinase
VVVEQPSDVAPDHLLDEVLAAYLKAVESGQTPDRRALLARHPDLADALTEFFDGLDELEQLAAPLRAVRTPPPGGADRSEAVESADDSQPTVPEPPSVQPASPTAAPGIAIPGYEILGVLGRGGMGVVYKARHVRLKRLVALKMIRAGDQANDAQRARFRREAEAVARLDHPNVVRIYDCDEHQGLPYYTMELVDGESLSARLQRGPLDPREAAALVRKLAEAIEYAHQNNVLHRDLKPVNVLLARGADGGTTARVTDFGLARLLDVEGSGDTESGALIGTAPYMAPEQAEGRREDVGPAADVWALGVILYECLAGRSPFRGGSTVETLDRVRHAEPAAPSSERPDIPRDLESICLKCLEKRPAARYRSAAALSEDLGRWLQGDRPVGWPTWPRRLLKAVRRRRRVAVLAGLGLAFLAGLGGLAAYLGRPAPATRPTDGVVLQQVQHELVEGRTVTLFGDSGIPQWLRWRAGESSSSAAAPDGIFTVRADSLGLLELLDRPPRESYRLEADVRHTRSFLIGEVGVYFARQDVSGRDDNVHLFTQLTVRVCSSRVSGPEPPATAGGAWRDTLAP